MSTEVLNPVVEAGLAMLRFSRGATLKLFEAIPNDKRLHCPIEGTNHAFFLAGHIAMTDEYFLKSVAGQEGAIDASWDKLFGMGAESVNDANVYPSWEELMATMAERRTALEAWFASLDTDALAQPLPDELKGFAPSVGALMGSIAWHEGFHAGQTTAIRKSLGQGSVFG